MSELAKEKLYREELIEAGAKGDNNLERIRSLQNGGGTGGNNVIANPELTGDETELKGLQIDNNKYAINGIEWVDLSGTNGVLTDEQVEKIKKGALIKLNSGYMDFYYPAKTGYSVTRGTFITYDTPVHFYSHNYCEFKEMIVYTEEKAYEISVYSLEPYSA